MKKLGKTIFVLDIGSTCVRALIGRALPDERVQVRSVFEAAVPNTAMHARPNNAELIAAIQQAASQAMREAEENVTHVWLAVPSTWVELVQSRGEVLIDNGEVRGEHVRAVLENATLPHRSATRQMLHMRNVEARLDGRIISEPYTERRGKHLRVDALLVICAARELQQRLDLVKQAGFIVEGAMLETFAAGTSTLTADERRDGVAVVDLGAHKTAIGVWGEGAVRDVTTIDTGGVSFAEELAMSLRIPLDAAARLQQEAFCACVPHLETHAPIEVPVAEGEVRRATPLAIAQILEPRVSELLNEVAAVLTERGHRDHVKTIVLTGGGAWMQGLRELAQDLFARYGWETRLGLPSDLRLGGELVSQTRYATVVGLLQEAALERSRLTFYLPEDRNRPHQVRAFITRFLNSFF